VPTPAAPPAAPVLPAGTPPAARRKTFLAFSLPSQSVDFTRAMRFEVLPELSRVGFDAKSTLHDFSGVTSDVSGAFTARLSAPGREVTGEVRASATTLDTGLADRNTEMAGTLDSAKFPTLTFRLASFQAAQTDPKTLASTGTGRGTLTIHGVAREVSVPLRISVDDARRVVVEGEVTVRMTEFGVTPPRKVVITVDDAVKVWVALRARATGAAE
jgi:polyisoprenoid-binding protein YceI